MFLYTVSQTKSGYEGLIIGKKYYQMQIGLQNLKKYELKFKYKLTNKETGEPAQHCHSLMSN